MKFLKKDYVKPVIIFCLLFIIISMFLMFVLSYLQYKEYKYELNKGIIVNTYNIIKEHPELEEEIIKSIRKIDENDLNAGIELFKKYSMNPNDIVFYTHLEEQFNNNLRLNCIIVGILGIAFLIIFLIYIVKKDKKIEQISDYLKRIQNRDYSLNIQDNTEGELSSLRNEIYKITVMLREQAENLEKDKKYLSDSLSDISHQLKTPLTSISVMIDILRENENIPNEKKHEFIYEISKQIDWINWLIISLLKLSKLDAGAVIFKKENINVKELINSCISKLNIIIEIKNQNIQINGDEKIYFKGDFNWMQEAIINIIKNCLEHTDENGVIVINFSDNVLYTEIKIKDNGIGIAKKDLPHIFERFYKGKNSNKDSVGIGLALAQSIVRNQGGDIGVKSIENKGTEFSIKIYK